ncbi:MAG TPA: KEOPS complex kinase/ATPase Bud32 [archaeon]|nr:KEOPS complex kinase/ATPase Bud32 [archaeon]
MEIIKRGAEAILYINTFEDQKVLVKERIKKNYRILQIDEKIRRLRTRKEVKLMTAARKIGVLTPTILHVDYPKNKIYMEFIDGTVVKDFLNSTAVTERQIKEVCEKIGTAIGKLHSTNIFHGDLTTSNMILRGEELYFIDFGLGEYSRRIEDKGVDMNLLYEALSSTHFKILSLCWQTIIKAYSKEYKEAEAVIEKVKEIEARARYAKRKGQV